MDTTLPVVETFHSIQGEGAHVGSSAFFIRLASCHVGCAWCDTKDSWHANAHPQISILQLAKQAQKANELGASFVVLTGGEPLHHDLAALCKAIRQESNSQEKGTIPIHLETSGVDNLTGHPNWITLSPKRHAPPQNALLAACHELKVVIHSKDDLIFAEEMAKAAINAQQNMPKIKEEEVNAFQNPLLFLQPGWNSKVGQQLALEHVMQFPYWRLSMQTHKWLNIP